MLTEPKILIIGAGAAGFSAAARLLQKGLQNITILEAKNRIGGRIHTVEFGENVVELGAQWVHGERGNITYDLAFQHNLLDSSKLLADLSKHLFVTAKNEIVPRDESVEILKIYYSISDKASHELKNAEGSYGEYFSNEFYKILESNPFIDGAKAEQFLDWMEKFDDSIQCSDSWFDVSAKGITEYWQCEGDSIINWKDRGYKTVFDLLSQKIPDPSQTLPIMEKIEFNKEVSEIDYSTSNVVVTTKDGSKYTASHVICTVSLGVLKENHSKMFVPPLPEQKQRAIKGLDIGTVNKIFLEFTHRWWPEDISGFSLIWSKEDEKEFLQDHGENNRWLCNVFMIHSVDYQPNILCAWVVGEDARYTETLSDAEVRDGMCLLLEKFFGKLYNVPIPVQMIRSKWYTDENVRGSYSFRSMNSERLNVYAKDLANPILMEDGKPAVLFAGEATHDHYYSTVHGAIETGFREADRLVHFQRTHGWLRQVINTFNKARRTSNTKNRSVVLTEIVIVGAGIAGLAAAKTLEDKGFTDYLLIEAQERVGGRIHSIPWNTRWIECGAQFLHGDKSNLAEICYDNYLLSEKEYRDGEGIFLRDNGYRVDEDLVNEIDDFVRTTLEECENCGNENMQEFETIGRLLRVKFKQYLRQKDEPLAVKNMKEEILDWNIRFLMIDNSCFSLDKLSVKNWGKFKFVGGSEYISFKTNYGSLAKLIADGLNNQNLRLNTAVEFIEWHQHVNKNNNENDVKAPIVLTLSDKSQILANCVIITSSLGYLKENHRKIFDPPLPSYLTLGIESLGFGLINKIFLDFGTPWWETGTKGFQFLWSKNGKDTFSNTKLAKWARDLTGFDVLPEQEGILLGWIGGQGAYIIENLSEQEIAVDCVNLLRHYLKLDNIPMVKRCKRTQWHSNKYIRGSYSHITTSCDKNHVTPATLAEPIWGTVTCHSYVKDIPILMFAGEGTHESFYSTTHGAYDTGIKQAQIFLQHRL